MSRVAEGIAETLKAYGTEYFFMVTGGDQDLWIALAGQGIRMLNCRSEQAAVYMADGYARTSGKPGLVYGQYGPGVANVVGALPEPYWAMSPVISLTTSIRTTTRDRFEYQELDQLPMHASVTRWNKAVSRPERAPEMVRAAIRAATGPIPGPVHLEIPSDMLRLDVEPGSVYADPLSGRVPSVRTAPPAGAVPRIVDALLEAERPVLLAGNGVLLSEAWEEVAAVAELLSVPVATSMGGKGAIREDSDLALGVIGRYSRKVANDIVREADLALVVGCRLGGLATDSSTLPSPSARILHVDIDAGVLGAVYREEFGVVADAKATLAAVVEELRGRGIQRDRTPWARRAAEQIREWWEEVRRQAARQPGPPIHPAAVIEALRAHLAPDDIVVADTGYMGAWTGAAFPVTVPGRSFLRANGSLGWAFPASLGAALAAPGRRAVSVTGDGGIAYHLMEIETARRHEIPAVSVVMNNQCLAFEYHEQKVNWGNRVIPQVNDYLDVDYAAVARAMGARGVRVSELAELDDALAEAHAASELTLLDVLVDREVAGPVTVYERALARTI
ncbi:MAG TPA: thiamine pyrophosphate-binding protein [Actinomycetes bacterium]|jgi:acetolactate synthase-1/2/3 large subunit|nr:thiamine pyrophosphate-binding protein [Actinomycetes bacterium]